MSWNSLEIHRKKLELWIWMKFGMILVTPCYQEKSISIKGRSEFWIPLKKEIQIDFTIAWIWNFIFEFRLLIYARNNP
jgi:hypothetical protein